VLDGRQGEEVASSATADDDGDSAIATALPHVADPPAWFGEPAGAMRTGGSRTGRWVRAAIGRGGAAAGAVSEPIVVSAFEGGFDLLEGALPVSLGGRDLRSVELPDRPGWRALATTGTPTVLVSGTVPEATLLAVLEATEVVEVGDLLSLRLGDLPDGYASLVEPVALGPDGELRRTLANESGTTSVNEISDHVDPLLAAAGSGADLLAVAVGDGTGWLGRVPNRSEGPLQFLVWSPAPGVVFEITSTEGDPGELVALAEATTAIDPDEWDERYGS